ncbi:MAG TPA: TetR/AcrR family transcriptional regulator [Acetobacteraceae bacterium]|nr:TetR/AcrR family transcriptional regulator [Acetobacteraceae bacterium]
MRTTPERKAETRERILGAALTLFRTHGVDAVGVDAIMHHAGLTHGGFYAYFASKEALVAEAATSALSRSADKWEQIVSDTVAQNALARIVDAYLDPTHIATTERGCVLTTMGPEVARRPGARPAITTSIRRMIEALTRCVPGRNRQRALRALTSMVGAVVLARLVDDSALAAELLAASRRSAGLR